MPAMAAQKETLATEISRRNFLGVLSGAACGVALDRKEASALPAIGTYKGTLCLFSKPLPGMDCKRLAQAAGRVGMLRVVHR
jgi:hypothetical protein